jgi:histidine triad (HIT) family protein
MSDCTFCRIVEGSIPSRKIYEDDDLMAFHDSSPHAPVHFLVIPKKHIVDVMQIEPADIPLIGRLIYTAQALAVKQGCGDNGARFVINCKSDGGQTVEHLHVHVLGGRYMDWPPG